MRVLRPSDYGADKLTSTPFWSASGRDLYNVRDLHLIVGEQSTFRDGKAIDSHDIHFAIRVRSYRGALEHFKALGYDAGAADPARRLRENPTGKAGFPQIYVLDPDRNVVEINAEHLD